MFSDILYGSNWELLEIEIFNPLNLLSLRWAPKSCANLLVYLGVQRNTPKGTKWSQTWRAFRFEVFLNCLGSLALSTWTMVVSVCFGLVKYDQIYAKWDDCRYGVSKLGNPWICQQRGTWHTNDYSVQAILGEQHRWRIHSWILATHCFRCGRDWIKCVVCRGAFTWQNYRLIWYVFACVCWGLRCLSYLLVEGSMTDFAYFSIKHQ